MINFLDSLSLGTLWEFLDLSYSIQLISFRALKCWWKAKLLWLFHVMGDPFLVSLTMISLLSHTGYYKNTT